MENQTETPLKLKWYQRIYIESQKKLVRKASKDRILGIDWCKGLAIIVLCFWHVSIGSVILQDLWVARMILLLWYSGPATFLFYSGINIALSYRRAREKNVPFKNLYLDTIRRMVGLFVVSTIWNLATNGVIFRWDILQCIAFCTILVFPLLKLSTITRFIIACVILATTMPLYIYLVSIESQSMLAQVLLYAFFIPQYNSPILPIIALTIIGTVVIDVIYPLIKQNNQANRDNLDRQAKLTLIKSGKPYLHFKILLMISLTTIALCVIFGSGPNLEPVFQAEATQWYQELQTNPIFAGWAYIPDFLLRQSPINYVYDLAIVLSLFLLAFYFFSIAKQQDYRPSKVTQIISFMGQYSLSYFLYGFLFTAFGRWATSVTMWFYYIAAMAILTLFFKFLLRKAYGSGLVEWIMVVFAIKWSTIPDIKDIQAVYPEKVRKG